MIFNRSLEKFNNHAFKYMAYLPSPAILTLSQSNWIIVADQFRLAYIHNEILYYQNRVIEPIDYYYYYGWMFKLM